MKIITTLALAITAIQAQADNNQIQGGAPFVTVGAGGTCDYDSIQAAITGNLSNTIRIASDKTYYENITINDRDMVFTGGYSNCTQAEQNITDGVSRPNIYAEDLTGTPFLITGNNSTSEVSFRHVIIGHGDAGIASTADVNLELNDVTLFRNRDYGVLLLNGDQNVTMNDVWVNLTESGPGIACSGEEIHVSISGSSTISNNDSPNVGGGITAGSGCTVQTYDETIIQNNSAVSNGGGISASGGAIVRLNGAIVRDNMADSDENGDGDGGGVFASGVGTIVTAVNAEFSENSAARGGAVYSEEQSNFTAFSQNTQNNPCLNAPCSRFVANESSTAGGAFYVTNSGDVLVMQSEIVGNGTDGTGVVGFARSNGSLEIETSMINWNGQVGLNDIDLFFVNGTANPHTSIVLEHVTIADNEFVGTVIQNNQGSFEMNSSIVHGTNLVSETFNPEAHSIQCAIVNETDSFSAGGTVTIDDPQFVDAANGNYRIKPTSPAVDYCYDAASLTVEFGYDIDLEGYNYDDPNVTDLHGHYDIGADEYRWDNDLIFMNGFEQD